jgi:hypothetical protein
MKSRKSKIISSVNLIAEERYLNSKFNLNEEEENKLPEFHLPLRVLGNIKLNTLWEKVGTKLPRIRDENFTKPEFEPFCKIYC